MAAAYFDGMTSRRYRVTLSVSDGIASIRGEAGRDCPLATLRVSEASRHGARIVTFPDGAGFTFNQYLVTDDRPLLFHTGPRRMFPIARDAVARVLPVERLRYIGLSHFEADESPGNSRS